MGSQRVVTAAGGTAARRAAKAGPQAVPEAPPEAPTKERAPKPRATRRQLDPDALAALEEQRAFLLTSLRDLEREHDAGDVDDVDYETLKDDYTARAAAVIRSIDDHNARAAAVWSGRRWSAGRVLVVTVALLALAIVAGVLMAQASGRRNAGDTVSGDIRQSTRDLLQEAQGQFGNGQALEAIKTYDKVLEMQPANREALTYKGWLLYRVAASSSAAAGGQVSADDAKVLQQRALESLDEAVRADPTYADAHIFRAIIFKDQGRNAEALAELNQVPADQVPAFMRDQVEQLRKTVSP